MINRRISCCNFARLANAVIERSRRILWTPASVRSNAPSAPHVRKTYCTASAPIAAVRWSSGPHAQPISWPRTPRPQNAYTSPGIAAPERPNELCREFPGQWHGRLLVFWRYFPYDRRIARRFSRKIPETHASLNLNSGHWHSPDITVLILVSTGPHTVLP